MISKSNRKYFLNLWYKPRYQIARYVSSRGSELWTIMNVHFVDYYMFVKQGKTLKNWMITGQKLMIRVPFYLFLITTDQFITYTSISWYTWRLNPYWEQYMVYKERFLNLWIVKSYFYGCNEKINGVGILSSPTGNDINLK